MVQLADPGVALVSGKQPYIVPYVYCILYCIQYTVYCIRYMVPFFWHTVYILCIVYSSLCFYPGTALVPGKQPGILPPEETAEHKEVTSVRFHCVKASKMFGPKCNGR